MCICRCWDGYRSCWTVCVIFPEILYLHFFPWNVTVVTILVNLNLQTIMPVEIEVTRKWLPVPIVKCFEVDYEAPCTTNCSTSPSVCWKMDGKWNPSISWTRYSRTKPLSSRWTTCYFVSVVVINLASIRQCASGNQFITWAWRCCQWKTFNTYNTVCGIWPHIERKRVCQPISVRCGPCRSWIATSRWYIVLVNKMSGSVFTGIIFKPSIEFSILRRFSTLREWITITDLECCIIISFYLHSIVDRRITSVFRNSERNGGSAWMECSACCEPTRNQTVTIRGNMPVLVRFHGKLNGLSAEYNFRCRTVNVNGRKTSTLGYSHGVIFAIPKYFHNTTSFRNCGVRRNDKEYRLNTPR